MEDEPRDAPEEPEASSPEGSGEDVVEPSPSADPSESPAAGEDEAPAAGEDEEPAGGEDEAPAAEGPPAEGVEDAPAAEEEGPAADEPPAEDLPAPAPEDAQAAGVGEDAAAAGPPDDAAAPAEEPTAPERRPRARREDGDDAPGEDVVPGAHLEPDLVLEEEQPEGEFGAYPAADAQPAAEEAPPAEAPAEAAEAGAEPAALTPRDLAADARYQATGKRKSSVARVILRPGSGNYAINGRSLEEYFPRPALQKAARSPLETAGYEARMDVVARIHGGGVAAQAGALRHGVARALVEADPNLRTELKRRGYLTRDAREKERKKAGLKKARKRPQFSKR